MAETKDERMDANTRHLADLARIKALRRECYALNRQLRDMGLACAINAHGCR